MLQQDEKELVAAGMSLLWVPKNPSARPVYAYKDKAYNLMNALDPEVGGEMVTQLLPEREISWVEKIKDNFLHPTSESLNAYIATLTGARPHASTRSEVGKSPAREEAITFRARCLLELLMVLFIGRCVQVHARNLLKVLWGDIASNPVTVEPKVVAASPTRKHSSLLQYLDYVVVFDTLSGLDIGVKRTTTDAEEDQATLTHMMKKKRKLLSDAKKNLDTEAALDVSERKRKVMGQTATPSESEVNLGVFAKKHQTNLAISLWFKPQKIKVNILSSRPNSCEDPTKQSTHRKLVTRRRIRGFSL
ncbi:hypothetical protein Hanom_Chr00s000003g01603941 [Helianthus anomalus]